MVKNICLNLKNPITLQIIYIPSTFYSSFDTIAGVLISILKKTYQLNH